VHLMGSTQIVNEAMLGDSDDDEEIDGDALVNADAYYAEKAAGKRKRGADADEESPQELAKKIRSAAALAGEDESEEDSDGDDEEEEEQEQPKIVEITEEVHAKKLAEYQGSNDEKTDLVENYNKCGGDWDLIMHFQAGGDESQVNRLKKIIKKERKNKKVKSFSAKETAKIVGELKAQMDEADLSDEEEEDSDDDEEEAEDMASFIEDDEDNAIEEESDDDDDEDDEEEEEAAGDDDEEESDDDDDEDDDTDDDDQGDQLKSILASMKKSPNLPKKEGKFKNYAKNTFKIEDEAVIKTLWEEAQKMRA